MTREREEVAGKIKAMIEEQDEITIESTAETLDIDSYTMMLIIAFVKEEIGIELDMDQLDFDAFNSVDSFVDLVMRQTEQAA
jgi:acyl carrier protein